MKGFKHTLKQTRNVFSLVLSAVLIATATPVNAQTNQGGGVYISCSEAILRSLSVAIANCGGVSNNDRCGVDNGGPLASNKVFFIGDSLTVAMVDGGDLLEETSSAGFSVFLETETLPAEGISGTPRRKGRSVEAIGAYNVNGILPKMQEHQDDYSEGNAGIIVIGLGTNQDVDFKSEIREMHAEIRSVNPTAQIYWVNTYFNTDEDTYSEINAELEEAVSELGQGEIRIMDFAAEASANPDKYSFYDGIHHTSAGNANKVEYILSQLPRGSANAVRNFSATGLDDRQKIAQTFLLGINSTQTEEITQVAEKLKLGGVYILGRENEIFTSSFFSNMNNVAGIPIIAASDEEGGQVQRFRDQIGTFPSAREMGSMSNEEVRQVGSSIGKQLKLLGINMVLAPVVDVNDPISEAIDGLDRGFSDDPAIVAEKAEAFANGLKNERVTPTYKHWPGLGTTPGNTDFGAEDSPSLSELEDRDLEAYAPVINKNSGFVMLSNAVVPDLTTGDDVVGYSPEAVTYLRETMNFTGLITTDDLNAEGVPTNIEDAVTRSLQAGVNMPLFKFNGEDELNSVIDAVIASGYNPEENLSKIMAHKNATLADQGNSCGVNRSGDNVKDAIMLLRSKGYTLEQSIGVVANMIHESGVVPARMQFIYARDPEDPASRAHVDISLIREDLSVSSADFEEAAAQAVALGGISSVGSIGWGLVQWTPASKMLNPSRDSGASPQQIDSMEYQIDFLVGQLTGEDVNGVPGSSVPETGAGADLETQGTVEGAAASFAVEYERCAECGSADTEEVQGRMAEAARLLVEHGNL